MSERFVALHGEGCTNLKQKLTHFLGENSMRTKDERASQAFAATLSGNGYGHELLLLCGIGFSCRVLSSLQYTARPQGPEADLSSKESAGLRFLSAPPFCFESGAASSGDSGVSAGDSPALVSASG